MRLFFQAEIGFGLFVVWSLMVFLLWFGVCLGSVIGTFHVVVGVV